MRLWFVSFLCVFVVGCAMTRTSLLDVEREIRCDTHAGSYSLPKTVINVEVLKATVQDSGQDVTEFQLTTAEAIPKEDKYHLYCLDYLPSRTADDRLKVQKATVSGEQTNLLQLVATDAIDESRFILQALTKIIFKGIQAGSGGVGLRDLFLDADKKKVLEVEFDPLDPYDTARINDTLKDFGFCFVLGGYSFNLKQSRYAIGDYCDNPKYVVGKASPRIGATTMDVALDHYKSWDGDEPTGIYYRPKLPYSLYLFVDANLQLKDKGGDPLKSDWQLRKTEQVLLENIAPIISVDVDRTYFARRKTVLVFNAGVLTNVCLYKTSELQELVEVPLTISKSIVALPTEIIQLRINRTDNQKALVDTQTRLIKAQTEYLNTLNSISTQNAAAPGTQPFDPTRSEGALDDLETSVKRHGDKKPFPGDACPTKEAT